MKFTGLAQFKCKCVKINQESNKFTLNIDKKKLKLHDSGTFKIGVDLQDDDYIYSRQSNKYTLNL